MATEFAKAYRREKKASKEVGAELRALPGVHHPIFKGKPVNHDPRERFVAEYMARAGRYNVFHAFYRELVQALYEQGASPYVFCVNVDAVIAALLLALLWPDYQAGRLTERDLETAAFTVFLYGRMIGVGGGDRRPPEPRPQHGHPDPGLGLRVRGLMDGAQLPPEDQPAIRTIAMPADTNPAGDIFGGWLMSQMDLAAGNLAARTARGRRRRWRSTACASTCRSRSATRSRFSPADPARPDVDAHPRHRLAPQPPRGGQPEGHLRHLRLRRAGRRGAAPRGTRVAAQADGAHQRERSGEVRVGRPPLRCFAGHSDSVRLRVDVDLKGHPRP